MRKIAILLLHVMLLTSCESIRELTVDYLLPAEVSFPDQLRKVVIVNNMPPADDGQPAEDAAAQADSPSPYLHAEQLAGDGQVAAEALAEAIASGNYFDEVLICDSALRTGPAAALTPDEVIGLAQTTGADFLLSIEDVQLSTYTAVGPDPYFGMYAGLVTVHVTPVVRAYIPGSAGRMQVSRTDSIFWSAYGRDIPDVRSRLAGRETVIREGSEYAGDFIARSILPHWTSDVRYYFAGGSVGMRDAAVSVRESDWQQAIRLWHQAYQAKSGKQRFYAAYNLALGYEMLNDIAQAQRWIDEAVQLSQTLSRKAGSQNSYYALSTLYQVQLNTRREGAAQVRLQMQRFEDGQGR